MESQITPEETLTTTMSDLKADFRDLQRMMGELYELSLEKKAMATQQAQENRSLLSDELQVKETIAPKNFNGRKQLNLDVGRSKQQQNLELTSTLFGELLKGKRRENTLEQNDTDQDFNQEGDSRDFTSIYANEQGIMELTPQMRKLHVKDKMWNTKKKKRKKKKS